jgi:hypothetical protein
MSRQAVRHYRALRAYQTDRRLSDDDLRALARQTVKLTDELSLDFPTPRPAPEEIAAEPSTWRFLWTNAIQGKVTAEDRLRERYPQFGLWLDMCQTHQSLWAATGRRCARQDNGSTAPRPTRAPGRRR